jgi:hypothetical protein
MLVDRGEHRHRVVGDFVEEREAARSEAVMVRRIGRGREGRAVDIDMLIAGEHNHHRREPPDLLASPLAGQ